MQRSFTHWWFHFQKTLPTQLPWLIASIFGLSLMSWFFNSVAPEQGSIIAVGIIIIAVTSFCFLHFLLNNVRRSCIITLGIVLFLFVRVLQLSDPLYFIVLILFLVSLELALRNR